MKQWRWTLCEETKKCAVSEYHSGQQPLLRDAMDDVAKTVEYMLECKDKGDYLSGCHWFEPGISHI
jgi:hypothetical protein